jgi:hypothetical protein
MTNLEPVPDPPPSLVVSAFCVIALVMLFVIAVAIGVFK